MTHSPKIDHARTLFARAGYSGLTWRDYAEATGAHHGAASGMLSRLHREGDVLRLAEKRDGASVYVHPDHAAGRESIAPRKRRAASDLDAEAIRAEVEAEVRAAVQAEMAEVREWASRMVREAQAHADAAADDTEIREAAYADGLAAGRAEADAARDADVMAARAAGYDAGRAEAEAQWQIGYDEGAKVGAAEAVKDLKRKMTAAGGEPFNKGREVGRREGEEVARRHVAKVAGELFRTISESAPVRTHHSTCYKQHADCAVKSVAASLGVPVARLKNEHAA